MEFKKYKRKGLSEMINWSDFTGDMTLVSISDADRLLSNEEFMKGYIARNPKNHGDKWYVAKKYFDDNLELEETTISKTLHNSNASGASKNVKDIIFWGNGDTFKLISKASSKNEGWMKSTKAMEIPEVGCVVQITTQQGENIAEAVTFVQGVKIEEKFDSENKICISRILVKI